MQCNEHTPHECFKMIRLFEKNPHQFSDINKLGAKLIECKHCVDYQKTPSAKEAYSYVQDMHAFAFIDAAIISTSLECTPSQKINPLNFLE